MKDSKEQMASALAKEFRLFVGNNPFKRDHNIDEFFRVVIKEIPKSMALRVISKFYRKRTNNESMISYE